MAFTNDYEQEMRRADEHERELQRRLGMQDGINTPQQRYFAPPPIPRQEQPRIAYRQPAPTITNEKLARGGKIFVVMCFVFLMIAAAVLLVMMEIIDQMNDKYRRCTAVTQAIVVDNIKSTSGGFRAVYFFVDSNGEHSMMDSTAAQPAKHRIGDKVQLHYNPNNYREFYVDKYTTLIIAVLSSIAGVFVFIGIIFGIAGSKMKKKSTLSTNTWQ